MKDTAAGISSTDAAKQVADDTLEIKARIIRNRANRGMGQVLEAIEPVNTARDRDSGTTTGIQYRSRRAGRYFQAPEGHGSACCFYSRG
ncbi:MAG: hypothetical protein KUG58_12185 [Marinosulfonomonas sp.]|nr:hypothetical protein [Marinosulfonomonas sp.]